MFMKPIFKWFFFVMFCCFSTVTFAQYKLLSKNQLIEDYEILYASLINYHPVPFLYTADAALQTYFLKQKASLPDSLSDLAFQGDVRKLIAQIKCGHTSAKPSEAWYKAVAGKAVLLPFDVKVLAGRLFIHNTLEGELNYSIGDEILAINKIPAADLLAEMEAIQERDGLTTALVAAMIEKRFRSYFLWLHGKPDGYELQFRTAAGEVKQTTLRAAGAKLKEVVKPTVPAGLVMIAENSWSQFRFDSAQQIGYLQIKSFTDRKSFKKYYKTVFKYLKQKPDARLIVDLRDNPGGYFLNGNRFLTYLSDEKFQFSFQRRDTAFTKNEYVTMDKWSKLTKVGFLAKPSKQTVKGQRRTTFSFKPSKHRFHGKVYVITNGITFSQAALVASHLKEQGAVFFGSETDGTESFTNAMLNHKLVLPNSGIEVYIPYYQAISNSTQGKFGYGIQPNYPVPPSLDRSTDNTLETVFGMLKIR